MATASKKEPDGAGDETDPAETERKKKLEKLKKEIRSILITAQQTGRSPEELERDYRDLNGRPIPYRELGFDNVFLLLDAMPDIVDAYQMDNTNSIVLFAKSSKDTEHLEYLISKAKPNKLGRFGGVINQAPEARRGTPERRKLIEKRLIEVASQYYPHFVPYTDLNYAYQKRFYEVLDPKGDFNVSAKVLFNLKLAHAFDMQGASSSGGFFSVRVKTPNLTAASNKENVPTASGSGSVNILGVGGFGPKADQQQQMAATNAAMAAAAAAIGLDPKVLEERQPNIPLSAVPQLGIPPEYFNHAMPPHMFFHGPPAVRFPYPNIPMPYGFQMMPFQVRPHPSQMPPGVPPAFFQPPLIGPPAHQLLFAPAGPFAGPMPAGPVHIGPGPPRFVMPNLQSVHNQFLPAVYHCPPPLAQPGPVAEMNNQQYPVQTASSDSGMGRTPSIGQLDVNAPVFEPSGASRTGSGSIHSSSEPAALGRASAPSVQQQPVPTIGAASREQSEKMISESSDRYRQAEMVRATEENSTSSVRGSRVASNIANETIDSIPIQASSSIRLGNTPFISALKEECRMVLRRYPNGLSYLQFGKAYREVAGKELNLEQLQTEIGVDLLSVLELAEVWTDVFRIVEKGREVLLFSKETPAVRPHKPERTSSQKDTVDQWVESTNEPTLVTEIWRVALALPGRMLTKSQIASEYEKATGKRFPTNIDIDDFVVKLFDYSDRFEFVYDGEVKCIAVPDADDVGLEIAASASASSSTPIPKDFVQLGETLVVQSLPITPEQLGLLTDDSDPKRFFQVILAQVFTPHKFYVQLESMYAELELMSKALNEYYAEIPLSNKAKVSPTSVQQGLLCAIRSDEDGLWYRGVIKEVFEDKFYTVFLVDFGTEMGCEVDSLRYLPRGFLKFPAQGIEARLALLSPIGQAWTSDSGERLAEICGTAFMWAELHKFSQDGIPEIHLTLTDENEQEIHVSDQLINTGFALFNEAEALAATVNHLDLEEEIESPDESPRQSVAPQNAVGGEANGDQEMDTSASILDTELEFKVATEVRRAVEERSAVSEDVLIMTKTYLSRKRLAINNYLVRLDTELINVAVEKLKWLEGEIEWLGRLLALN